MIRKIIQIDESKCNGYGACAAACHEGAIGMIDGKAKLLRDDYCDGLGDCLPSCPTGAIEFVEREAAAYDAKAVQAKQKKEQDEVPQGCPGARMQKLLSAQDEVNVPEKSVASQLAQWPVQIKLLPIKAPYFAQADLLIAADCTAYAYGNFHQHFMKKRVTLIGCPKLDRMDYSEKLAEILRENEIQSVTVVRMEVPCCGGMEHAVKTAI